MQYKVLTQERGKMLKVATFSPDALEEEINGYAAQGWRVVSMAAGTFPGHKNDLLVVLLEHA